MGVKLYLPPPNSDVDFDSYNVTLDGREYLFDWSKNSYDGFWYLTITDILDDVIKADKIKVLPGKILAEFITGRLVCTGKKLNYSLYNAAIEINWVDKVLPNVIAFREVV
jgi:argininosuccinate synthase